MFFFHNDQIRCQVPEFTTFRHLAFNIKMFKYFVETGNITELNSIKSQKYQILEDDFFTIILKSKKKKKIIIHFENVKIFAEKRRCLNLAIATN